MNYSSFRESISKLFRSLEPLQLLLFQVEVCCEITILQQVTIIFFCHIFSVNGYSPVLCGYCTNIKLIKGFSICFCEVQVKNNVTDDKFVGLWLHLKGNAEISTSCASIYSFAFSSYYEIIQAITPDMRKRPHQIRPLFFTFHKCISSFLPPFSSFPFSFPFSFS